MVTRLLLASLIVAILSTCSYPRHVYKQRNYQLKASAGMERVLEGLYFDRYEVSNGQWRAYTSWISHVHGQDSKEYKSSLPDTTVWSKKPLGSLLSAIVYYRHPAYADDPVVGITQQQVEDFSEWRADRTFETLLDLNGIIKSKKKNLDGPFTIKSYFEDLSNYDLAGQEFQYYPVFRLPSIDERGRTVQIADSVNTAYFNSLQILKPDGCENGFPHCNTDVNASKLPEILGYVTRPVHDDCVTPRTPSLYHLRGNVNEWLSEPNVAAGGGWPDAMERILKCDTFHISEPNAWTGFRCVMEWKKWEG